MLALLFPLVAGSSGLLDVMSGNSKIPPSGVVKTIEAEIRVAARKHLDKIWPFDWLISRAGLRGWFRSVAIRILPDGSGVSGPFPAAIFPPLILATGSFVMPFSGDAKELTIRILDANLWLLPAPAANGQDRRMADFARLARQWQPDLITLQEVWLPSFANALHRLLPDYFCIVKPMGWYNQTGLVVFSRFPPESASVGHFDRTPRHNLVELFAHKGFLRACLRTPAGMIELVDTHLYAPSAGPEQELTRRQLASVLARAGIGSYPLILAGDLNQRVGSVSSQIGKNFLMEDDLKTSTVVETPGRKIDYVTLRNPAAGGTIRSLVLRQPIVSDHHPVLATVTIILPNAGN